MAIPNPYGSLGTIWSEMGLDYSKFDQGTAEISRRTIELERLTQQSLSKMGEQWTQFGARMSLAVTAPLMATATQMTWAYATFEQSMVRTAAVAQATEAELAAMERTARELGATTQFTAQQAAEGMQFLAMAGFDATQTIEAMPGVLQLAASAQLDLATAADITTNILTGYGLAIEELARVNDVLVSAMTGSNTNLQQLGEAMKYAGPVASAAGIEFEDAAAALALMGNAGIQASMAGTSLRGAVTRLLNPTGQVRDLIRELGLDIYDTNGNLVSMVEVIAELERAQVSAGDMMALFGQRAGPAMQALVDQGSAALAEFVERLRESEGVAERIASMQEDTLAGSLRALRSAYDELALTLAGTAAPALRDMIETVTETVRWFADLPEPVQRTVIAVGGLTAAVGPLSMALGALMRSLTVLSGPAGLIMLAAGAATSLGLSYASAQREQERFYDNTITTARALRDQADELDRLVRRYEELSGKPERSSEEHDELEQVMRRIVEIQPDIAAGYDDISEAIERNIDPLKRYTEALRMQSETEIMIAALRAQHDIEHLRTERDRLNAQVAELRERLGPEYERTMLIVERSARAQQLYAEALQQMRQGIPEAEALRPLREFFDTFAAPGANIPTVLTQLEREAENALIPVGRTADQIIALEGDIASLNDQIARAERVIKVYAEGWEALDEAADKAKQTVAEPTAPVFTDIDDVGDLTSELYAILAEEQALWQARVALARYGARDIIEQFGDVENILHDYLAWLDDIARDESLDEIFRGRMAEATRDAIRQLERLHEEAVGDLGDMANMTAEEIVSTIMGAIDRYGPVADRLRQAMAVGELPFIGDDLAEAARRIENFYRNMVDTGRVSMEEHLRVLQHQVRELERAGEVGSDAWLRVLREVRSVSERMATEAERRDQEERNRMDRRVRDLVEAAEREAFLYDWTYSAQADRLQEILDQEEMTAELRADLAWRVAELRKRAADQAAAAEAQAAREAEAEAVRAAAEAERELQADLRAQEQRVQARVEAARFLARLLDEDAGQQADRLTEILSTETMAAETRLRLSREVALLRKQHADEVAEAERQAALAAAREAEREAQEVERQAEQAARDQDRRVQREIQRIERQAELERWSTSAIADALAELEQREQMSAEVREDLIFRIARTRMRAEDEALAEAKTQAAEAERLEKERTEAIRRLAEEQQRDRDRVVQSTVDSLRQLARYEDWSAERQVEALERVLDTFVMSSELREQLEWNLLFLRKQATEDAATAEEEARQRVLRDAIAEAEHKARLYEWTSAQQADALQHVLDVHQTTDEERLQLTRRIAELRARAEREAAEAARRAEEEAVSEAEQKRRQRLQDALDEARFHSQLYEWTAEQYAEALEDILRTAETTAEEEQDILRQVALLRAQYARQVATQQERIRKETLQAAYDEARFLAELYDWTREQYIAALQQILEDHEDVADERIRIERELALEQKRLAQEIAEAESQALRETYAEAARLQIAQAQTAELSIAAVQRQKDALTDLALHYLTLGEEGSEALKLIDEALQETQRRLDDAIAGHPAMQFIRQLEGVLSGRRSLGDAGMAWIDQQVGDAASRIIDDMSARTANFIDLSTSGAMDIQSAWQTAFDGFSISGRNAYTLIIGEVIRLFTAVSDARRRLQEQGRRDAEQRMQDELRFARLTGLGFVGEFETATRSYTERVSYLFGLFHSNVQHTEQVTSERTEAWLARMEELWADAQRRGQSAMQQAFQAPETAQLATFYRSLNVGIYESVRDGLIDAFAESQTYARLMAPLWQAIDTGIDDAFADGMFDPDRFWRMVGPALAQFQQEVELLEFPFREIQNIIREIEEMLGIPSEAARGATGGTRLTALSGEQRDFFAELMRPVRYLDHMPQYHTEHMRRLDDIIGLLNAGDSTLGEGFAAYIEQQQAILHASEIIVEHIASATFTGPVTLLADGQDIRRAVRRAMDEEYAAGAASGRSTGL